MPETGPQWAAGIGIAFLYGMAIGVVGVVAGVDAPWWFNGLHFLGGSLTAQGFHWWNHHRQDPPTAEPDPMDVAAWAAVTLGRPIIICGNRVIEARQEAGDG
jgi:hypothetical protein